MKRWPMLVSPARRPWSSKGTVRSSNLATIQRTGRENRRPVPSPQRMVFEKRRPSRSRRAVSGTRSSTGRASSRSSAATNRRPPWPSRSTSWMGSRPCLRAKPIAAWVARPSASNAASTGGPSTTRVSDGWASGRPAASTAMRRGATQTSIRPGSIRSASRLAFTSPPACSTASLHALEGSSSQPTSTSRSGTRGLRAVPPGEVGLGHPRRQRAHPPDVRAPLGRADDPARVEQVEGVAALQHLVIGRQHQALVEAARALGLVLREAPEQDLGVRDLEVVAAPLALALEVDVAVGHALRPGQVVDRAHALEVHRDALEAVGQLGGDRPQVDAARLLEVGELGDLHAVHPDLPAEPPCSEGRPLPVVL